MRELTLEVSFVTPAFLGNASNESQWRVPPFKAMLRQWWRIVKAPEVNYNYVDLLAEENELFGFAHSGCQKSKIKFRLSKFSRGTGHSWPQGGQRINHPNVDFPVGTELYLGFGPLSYDRVTRSSVLSEKYESFIQPSVEKAVLHLIMPELFADEMTHAIALADWFGTMGARARNGWGSISFDNIAPNDLNMFRAYFRAFADCMQLDWPHSIGVDDNGPLIWQCNNDFNDWHEAMGEVARLKIAFRTLFPFAEHDNGQGGNAWQGQTHIEERHVLAYPVTHHNVAGLGRESRLANQLRFKVKLIRNRFRVFLIHIPCKAPDSDFLENLNQENNDNFRQMELGVWQAVHNHLDAENGLVRAVRGEL